MTLPPFTILAHGIGACCGPGTWDIVRQSAGVLGIVLLIVVVAGSAIAFIREVRRGGP